MKIFNPFPIVRADFRRNRLLVLTTVLLVALAVATGIAVISQERALRQGSARAADDFDILIGAPGSPTQLVLTTIYLRSQAIPLLDGDILAQAGTARGVRYAAPIAFGDHWHGYPLVGTTTDFATRGGTLAPAEGRMIARRGEAIVGAAVKLPLGSTLSPQHGAAEVHEHDDDDDKPDIHHAAMTFAVVGRLPPRNTIWDTAILVPIEDVWAVHTLPDGHDIGEPPERIGPPWVATRLPGVPAIAVKPDSVAAAYAVRNQFRNARSVALFPAEVLNELYGVLGNVRDLMSALALATQVLVVAAVLMALLVGFLARRRQFAVLRAIGASRAYVFCVIWIEVALLILLGAVIGLLLGLAAAMAFSAWLRSQIGFALPTGLGTPEFYLVAGLIAVGGLIAILPAWLAFRRPIAEELVS